MPSRSALQWRLVSQKFGEPCITTCSLLSATWCDSQEASQVLDEIVAPKPATRYGAKVEWKFHEPSHSHWLV